MKRQKTARPVDSQLLVHFKESAIVCASGWDVLTLDREQWDHSSKAVPRKTVRAGCTSHHTSVICIGCVLDSADEHA